MNEHLFRVIYALIFLGLLILFAPLFVRAVTLAIQGEWLQGILAIAIFAAFNATEMLGAWLIKKLR
jgi:ABC-type uncharacterized transport system fused permease/ATPase subunit